MKEKKFQIHAITVVVWAKHNLMKLFQVKIPKGVDDGTRIRLAGKGEAGNKGGANGDLIFICFSRTS